MVNSQYFNYKFQREKGELKKRGKGGKRNTKGDKIQKGEWSAPHSSFSENTVPGH